MKKFLAFAAVAGMAALVSCGGADEAAKKMHDSMMADSIAQAVKADSMKMADSINAAEAQKAAAAKASADSMAMAAHQDSVDKKLIKTPKK
jgi:phage I-like protein